MRKRSQSALLASVALSLFVCMAAAWAETSAPHAAITSQTDGLGRKIYVNEEGGSANPTAAATSKEASTPRSTLVYWSAKEHRYKPVPTSGATIRAARSAASEVTSYLGDKAERHQILNRPFTQQDVDAAIEQAAARHNVDSSLVRSVVKVESNFNPNAVSHKGAMGLMQLMPSTARSLNVSNPFDPAQNVDAGVRHLRRLLDTYKGDVRLSLAAYNAGSGAVARSAGIPHFKETQNYVRRITALYNSGGAASPFMRAGAVPDPVHVERDARGVLFMSNTE